MTDFVRSPATGPFHAEIAEWGPGIYQWQTEDVILGGPDGNDNWPIAALTNRTLWLRQKIEAAENGLAAHAAGRDHPAATTTQIGFVELATVTESVTGTDTVRAVTPAGLSSALAAALSTIPAVPAASDTVAGRVELATVTESVTGTDTVRAVTPAGLAAALSANTPDLSGYLRYNASATLEAGFWTKPVVLAVDGGAVTPDLGAGNVFTCTATTNLTLGFPAGLAGKAGMFLVIIKQDGTGGRTLTLASGYKLAGGSWSAAPNAVNLLWITSDGSGTALDVVIAQRGA